METGGYTRVTLAGARRRVDVVFPAGEPIGRLLPEALQLTGELPGHPPAPRALATVDGRVLDPNTSLGQAGVLDGALLRVVGHADAPPPPVVLDVTEEVADEFAGRPWIWGPGPRRWTATATAVVSVLLVGHLVSRRIPEESLRLLVATAVGLVVAGTLLGRSGLREAGVAAILAGSALGTYVSWSAGPWGAAAIYGTAAALSITAAALGAATELGRGGLIGAGAGLALLDGWLLASRGLPTSEAAAVLAVVSAVLLGLLPRIALVLSGLTALDDRRSRDEDVTRGEIGAALAAAHRGLTLTVVATAASGAAAGWLLAASSTGWTVGLAILLGVVLAVRVRSFPLVGSVLALVTAAAVVLVGLLLAALRAAPERWQLVALVGMSIAVIAAISPLGRPPEHLLARFRRILDRIEALTMLAMPAVLLGVFGIYGRLLHSF